MRISRSIHVAENSIISFIFTANILLCVCVCMTSSLSIYLLMALLQIYIINLISGDFPVCLFVRDFVFSLFLLIYTAVAGVTHGHGQKNFFKEK